MVDNPEGRGQQYYNITATLCNLCVEKQPTNYTFATSRCDKMIC